MTTSTLATRGTSNGNQRGSATDRRARRAWMITNYASNVPGYCRCYRCGVLLYNPDNHPNIVLGSSIELELSNGQLHHAVPLTIDRIIPGCQGGTYRRQNIRPACGHCNSETGAVVRSKK